MMERIYHPWNLWEDFRYNFYGSESVKNKKEILEQCASLLRDLDRFEAALKTITSEWKYSCEHNLTNEALNKIAYLGQAAMALVYQAPSSISRGGYNLLTPEEQKAADEMTQKYLDIWTENHLRSLNVTKAV